MDILIKALQLVLSLSILVITHEAGHFFFAKLFKTRVEKFYLFFNPWFSLFKFKKGETEYGIGWLPLGGYVKISGMIDESMDKEQMKQPMQPWEFRAKPAWQRLLIMLGGVMVNAISAPLIFWMVLYTWGETYLPLSEAKFGMQFHEVMHEVGFQDGDHVLGINGQEAETIRDVVNPILFGECQTVDIKRNGEKKSIEIPDEFFRTVLANDASYMMTMRVPTVVDSVVSASARTAGLMKGDSIVGINGVETPSYDLFRKEIQNYRDTTITLYYARSYSNDTVAYEDPISCEIRTGFLPSPIIDSLTIHTDAEARLGIIICSATRWMTPKVRQYGFAEACPAGIEKGYNLLCDYLKQIPMLFSKEGATKVGGFGTIGNMFPAVWDWEAFWFNTAFLAIILAVMNVLPIPALDGGHVLFLLVEIITRRKPSDKFLEYAQTIGMFLLFALIIWANFNDVIRAFF